jgi:hypothetical protein
MVPGLLIPTSELIGQRVNEARQVHVDRGMHLLPVQQISQRDITGTSVLEIQANGKLKFAKRPADTHAPGYEIDFVEHDIGGS